MKVAVCHIGVSTPENDRSAIRFHRLATGFVDETNPHVRGAEVVGLGGDVQRVCG